MGKPILCMDFDGVIHSYASGWVQPDFIPNPPVPGALDFLDRAREHFDVQIFSSRSHHPGGIRAMQIWMEFWARKELSNEDPTWRANGFIDAIAWNKAAWPMTKPPAFLSIDDRGLTFTGTWPDLDELRAFKPWNKK